jgi:chaperone modulatory protein CbpM
MEYTQMTLDNSELTWLDEHHEVSFDDLAELSGLSVQEILQLVESGALIPSKPDATSTMWVFSSHSVISIRKLSRLKHDFELEPNALSLVMIFLERIRILELELNAKIGLTGNTASKPPTICD